MVKLNDTNINLISNFDIRCTKCSFSFNMATSDGGISENLTWAILGAGSTYAQIKKLMSLLNIKIMDEHTFIKHKRKFDTIWVPRLNEEMRKNGEEERRLAIERGDVVDNVPWICVKFDGGYSKKCSRRYDGRTCVVAVFGVVTNKLLAVMVKNLDCSICDTTPDGVEPKNHVCSKSGDKHMKNLEGDLIVEAFKQSMEKHGVQYRQYVSDCDLNIEKALKTFVPYPTEKHDDVIHTLRAYKNKVNKVKSKMVATVTPPITALNLLTHSFFYR
jgi:hypothetical protein